MKDHCSECGKRFETSETITLIYSDNVNIESALCEKCGDKFYADSMQERLTVKRS